MSFSVSNASAFFTASFPLPFVRNAAVPERAIATAMPALVDAPHADEDEAADDRARDAADVVGSRLAGPNSSPTMIPFQRQGRENVPPMSVEIRRRITNARHATTVW